MKLVLVVFGSVREGRLLVFGSNCVVLVVLVVLLVPLNPYWYFWNYLVVFEPKLDSFGTLRDGTCLILVVVVLIW